MNQLDAEQKSRLRRIIRDLSTQTGEDTPEHVASMLIEDPLVWLALLSRPEESTRQAAVQQLTVLLNVPIAVDPKAQPDSQAKARDAADPDREDRRRRFQARRCPQARGRKWQNSLTREKHECGNAGVC